MQILNADSWKVTPDGPASTHLATFDGDVTIPFHAIRMSLKHALICWHETGSPAAVTQRLQDEATAFAQVYSGSQRLSGLLDDFEMHLAMAVALTNEQQLADLLRSKFSFRPCRNGYAYYVGFKQAVLGLMLADEDLVAQAREHLSQHNATKCFYFPSTALILAALAGDLKALKTNVKAISRKFDGYAKRCDAVNEDQLDVSRLDMHWFSPYPDWAFYAQAIRRYGRVEAPDTFWMPMSFLNSYAAD